MADLFRAPTSTTSGITLAADEDLFVASGVLISRDNANGTAVSASGGGHEFLVYGTIASTNGHAVYLGGNISADIGNSVDVKAGGQIRALGADWSAIRLDAAAGLISNNGLIASDRGTGIVLLAGGTSAQTVTINNFGTIDAGQFGIGKNAILTSSTIVFNNSGVLMGDIAAYGEVSGSGASSRDVITNTGRIAGMIDLGSGNDTYNGSTGRLTGKVFGRQGIDTITGGVDADWFEGGTENDTLTGNAGNDRLYGQQGIDTLLGGLGADILDGGTESDTLNGGLGIDSLKGGAGNDFFVFSAPVSAANRDVITDFSNVSGNNDTIRLENAYFTKIGNPGVLRSTAFKLSTQAKDADDRIIYNKTAGYLYYDPDGSGAAAPVLIAQFSSTVKPTLTYADFQVI